MYRMTQPPVTSRQIQLSAASVRICIIIQYIRTYVHTYIVRTYRRAYALMVHNYIHTVYVRTLYCTLIAHTYTQKLTHSQGTITNHTQYRTTVSRVTPPSSLLLVAHPPLPCSLAPSSAPRSELAGCSGCRRTHPHPSQPHDGL